MISLQNWLLDGFPRTLGQGQLLDPLLRKLGSPLNLIVNLDVPDEVILSRIAGEYPVSAAQHWHVNSSTNSLCP